MAQSEKLLLNVPRGNTFPSLFQLPLDDFCHLEPESFHSCGSLHLFPPKTLRWLFIPFGKQGRNALDGPAWLDSFLALRPHLAPLNISSTTKSLPLGVPLCGMGRSTFPPTDCSSTMTSSGSLWWQDQTSSEPCHLLPST